MTNQPVHLLLIEDDPAVACSLQDGLVRDGYAVTWKETGAAGIAFARDHNPHLVILDVRLLDGSGFDFRQQGAGYRRRSRRRRVGAEHRTGGAVRGAPTRLGYDG